MPPRGVPGYLRWAATRNQLRAEFESHKANKGLMSRDNSYTIEKHQIYRMSIKLLISVLRLFMQNMYKSDVKLQDRDNPLWWVEHGEKS
jgi:hypothetical protein